MTLFNELKRRNVFRVGAAYVVVCWLLLQVADVLLDNFGAPDWVFKSFTALLALGFPLAVFLSWAFELTPEGMKRTAEVTAADEADSKSNRRVDRVILVGAIALIAVMAIERVWFAGRDGATSEPLQASAEQPIDEALAPARSIAVLAFEDLSPDGDQAYFAEGISEELLNLLARIDDFKVAARTSSFNFKGRQADIGEIGRALNVETVLEGSVRKAGDQVRVTAQLIEVGSGYHLWSQSYDRRLENIFTVQDEIAAAIVQALRLKLDIDAETSTRTANVVAYDHYLRGRQLAREPSRAGLLRGIEQYEKAIALDPEFAAAYSGIAEAWIWLEDYGGVRSAEAFPKAEQAARRALALDAESAEALAAMAMVQDRYYNDKAGAQELFERTLRISPNYVTAYNLYGDVLRDLGQLDRMIEVHRAAVELDPLSVFMKTRLASKLSILRQHDEAAAILSQVLAESPGNDYAHEELGGLARSKGRFANAVQEFRRVHFARLGDPFSAAQIAILGAVLDDRDLAEAWIAAARARGEDNRWELVAREELADWSADWTELDEIGRLRGGPAGAMRRGVAAAQLEAWPEARRYLHEALQLDGYAPAQGARASHAETLLHLAWVEQRMEMPDWEQRLDEALPPLQALRDQGAGSEPTGFLYPAYGLARLAALRNDRAGALGYLLELEGGGFGRHWFLERDPVFAAWRDDTEFQAFVHRLKQHAAAERAKLAGMEVLP
jgi:TolB-like protein/Tfp pilus assembly protein PilF